MLLSHLLHNPSHAVNTAHTSPVQFEYHFCSSKYIPASVGKNDQHEILLKLF